MYLNSVTIIGNLTRDVELKSLPNGTKVANMSIATNRVWKDQQGQKQEATEYHNIVVFGKQAETSAQWLAKGSQVLVQGRLQTRSWEDTNINKTLYRTEIIAESVQFGSKPGVTLASKPLPEKVKAEVEEGIQYPEEDINPEDIPF